MLSQCTKLKPCLGDGLPRLICKECTRHLKRTYSFNIQCEESDQKLQGQEMKLEEKVEVKGETTVEPNNTEDDQKFLFSMLGIERNVKSEIHDDIKLEPRVDNDSCWDADDDSVLLHIKEKKNLLVLLEGEIAVSESKLPHQCDICGKFLSTKSNLKAHKICHTELRPYRCPDCPATFRGHSALFQHRKVHTREKPYHCEYCPKQFSRRTGLVNHIRIHTGEKLYRCDICFKTFVQSAQLSIHMKRHKGDKTFLCQDCGKGFPIKADLNVHQRIHNGEKPYACHLCTKTFATSGNLNIHVRIHNKEIRYKCKECQRGFVTCSAYNVHLKRHKGQRDYECECGKTFYTSSALKQHKVVHTGEKKYQCKICERKFTQTSHLNRHFKREHAKPNVPVPTSEQYKRVLHDGVYKDAFLHKQQAPLKCEGT
ncbi:zinc-finger double domain-containing protein [Phthorimaea operculella]|nr:zinc-finger double domain-containing protein [Phthorimaea operculella]